MDLSKMAEMALKSDKDIFDDDETEIRNFRMWVYREVLRVGDTWEYERFARHVKRLDIPELVFRYKIECNKRYV